jgi:hypothetical protein
MASDGKQGTSSDQWIDEFYYWLEARGLTRPKATIGKLGSRPLVDQPVTINVYRVQRTRDAEACQPFAEGQEGRGLVYKVDEFNTITTSKNGSTLSFPEE